MLSLLVKLLESLRNIHFCLKNWKNVVILHIWLENGTPVILIILCCPLIVDLIHFSAIFKVVFFLFFNRFIIIKNKYSIFNIVLILKVPKTIIRESNVKRKIGVALILQLKTARRIQLSAPTVLKFTLIKSKKFWTTCSRTKNFTFITHFKMFIILYRHLSIIW